MSNETEGQRTEHTPGERWSYELASRDAELVFGLWPVWEVGCEAEQLGYALVPGSEERARLIASAPDLLAALEAFVAVIEDKGEVLYFGQPLPDWQDTGCSQEMHTAYLAAKSTIARATGEDR